MTVRKPRKNPNPVRKLILVGVFSAVLPPSLAFSQNQTENVLKKPIVESGLLEKVEEINAADAAKRPTKSVAVPRAVAVRSIDSIATPDTTGETSAREKKSKGPTEITAEKATFDNRKHIAIFIGSVVVNDPEFYLTCDKLTAFLKSDAPAGAAEKPAPKPASDAKPGAQKKGGLDRALAEGNVNIIQEKTEADGKTSRSTAKSKTADYDARTGDIILKGRPIVHQGMNQCEATSDGTVMTLNRDRNMSVDGPNKTIITDKAEMEKK